MERVRAELISEMEAVLIEDVRGDVKLVHDRIDIEMAGLNRRMDDMFTTLHTQFTAMQSQFAEVLRRIPPP